MSARAAGVALGAALAVCSSAAPAEPAYPSKMLRIVVAYTPAGTADILARTLGRKLTEAWAQPVMVDNRPGANGSVGTEAAAKAPADGYTLLMGTSGTHAVNPALQPNLGYDAVRDFAPVSRVAIVPNILVVHPALPVRNVKELVAYAKANPGKLSHGSPGTGSGGHLSAELLKLVTGVRMTHVAYKGSAATVQGLVNGEVQVVIDTIVPYLPQIKAGRIRALAVTPAQRSPLVPELPTLAEAGVKGFDASTWFGLFAPAGTPDDVVARLASEVRRILDLPDVRDRLIGLGAQPAASTPEEFARFVQDEAAKWARVVRDANVTLD